MSVRWRRRFLNPAAHWRQESHPDGVATSPIQPHFDASVWRRAPEFAGWPAGAGARNILVVEDEHLIATGLAEALQDAGSIVLGPVPTVDKAIKKIESEPTSTARLWTSTSAGCLPTPSRTCSSPGRFPSSLPQAMRTTFFGTDILKLRIAPNPICSRPRRKRWSRPCRSHDD